MVYLAGMALSYKTRFSDFWPDWPNSFVGIIVHDNLLNFCLAASITAVTASMIPKKLESFLTPTVFALCFAAIECTYKPWSQNPDMIADSLALAAGAFIGYYGYMKTYEVIRG